MCLTVLITYFLVKIIATPKKIFNIYTQPTITYYLKVLVMYFILVYRKWVRH